MKRNLLFVAILLFLVSVGVSYNLLGIQWKNFDLQNASSPKTLFPSDEKVKVVQEESVITNVVDSVSPSVVTIGIEQTRRVVDPFSIDPFDPFGSLRQPQSREENIKQDIGSGFIVTADGMIVTNKHVVSDPDAKYSVITKDDKKYDVTKIFRDPTNDLAILQIEASGLQPITMGDSSSLKVGQLAIAIGTALGEFRNTVTVGVISGVGRGITAGSPYESSAERLDNVIQTDAAINPGNSGGPLLNSAGQVIGVNTAVAAGGQNIGFALPINVVKEALNSFNATGKFARPYMGVQYKMISRDLALLNEVPEGAYVQEVVEGSPAKKGGVQRGDIITKIDGTSVKEGQDDVAKIISSKKIGDKLPIELWRDGEIQKIEVTLEEFSG